MPATGLIPALLEKIADKKFITPTALGQYLKEIYNDTVEEFEGSKAKLVDNLSKQFKTNYEKQISNLNQQLIAEKRLLTRTIFIAVIIAIIIGIIIGMLVR